MLLFLVRILLVIFSFDLLSCRARIYEKKNDLQQTLTYLDECLEHSPNYFNALRDRVTTYIRLDQLSRAAKEVSYWLKVKKPQLSLSDEKRWIILQKQVNRAVGKFKFFD